jgi:hypothetical protein
MNLPPKLTLGAILRSHAPRLVFWSLLIGILDDQAFSE